MMEANPNPQKSGQQDLGAIDVAMAKIFLAKAWVCYTDLESIDQTAKRSLMLSKLLADGAAKGLMN